jgi:hypothetical protein
MGWKGPAGSVGCRGASRKSEKDGGESAGDSAVFVSGIWEAMWGEALFSRAALSGCAPRSGCAKKEANHSSGVGSIDPKSKKEDTPEESIDCVLHEGEP